MPAAVAPSPFFIHIDLDGLWTLPDCYGYSEGDDFTDDPVFAIALDRLLGLFRELGIRATFFIVGRDLELPDKARRVAAIAAAGHALASHSYSHDLALERRDPDTVARELQDTNIAIERLTGTRPLGFRAPGYGAGPNILHACHQARFRYDGSLFPSPWGGALRFLAGRLRARSRSEMPQAAPSEEPRPPHPPLQAPDLKLQYGGAEPGPRGVGPQAWPLKAAPGPPLLRLPVAVSPMLRLPLQASLAMLLFGERRTADALLRLHRRRVPVTFLIHGLDALGADDLTGRLPRALATSRAFQLPSARKLAFLRHVLSILAATGSLQLTEQWIAKA